MAEVGEQVLLLVFIKDNFSMPAVYAVARARKYLDAHESDVSLGNDWWV